jgi:S-adenosylmethionine-diacylgycerolhomoserine-N-methlytransferase
MTDSRVQRFYCHHALFYDQTRWMFLRGRRRAVRQLQLQPDSAVLEVGCGTGMNFPYILSVLDRRDGQLVGVDFSTEMLRKARKKIDRKDFLKVELVRQDASNLALDRHFDAVLFAYSLSMIPEWEAALRRAYEHLRPGGRLVVLDFGDFGKWGVLAEPIRRWLRWFRVDPQRAFWRPIGEWFADLRVERYWGGYYVMATGRKK